MDDTIGYDARPDCFRMVGAIGNFAALRFLAEPIDTFRRYAAPTPGEQAPAISAQP